MKKIFLNVLIACCCTVTQAQVLNPGDKCPDFTFNILSDGKLTQTRLSDYKGKMVLLDFWSTNCGPCIAAFPKMESLQKQFGDKIVVLPAITVVQVNEKNKEYVAKFWANNKITKTVSLPTVITDTANLLFKSFPHQGVPHEVWIDAEGVVRGVTSAAYVTPQNIQKLLDGERVDWVVNRQNTDFKAANTLLIPVDNGAGMPDELFYTSLTSYLPTGQQNILKVDSNDRYKKYLYMNIPALTGYRMMLYMNHRKDFMWANRFVLEVKDRSSYVYTRNSMPLEEWQRKHAYCYEAVLPLNAAPADFYAGLGADLNRFLQLNGRIEKRMVDCFVLKRLNTDDKLLQSPLQEAPLKMDEYHNVSRRGHTNFVHSFEDFLVSINRLEESPIVIDETGYKGKINVPLVFTTEDGKTLIRSMSDIDGMRKQLPQYGLDLVPAKRELEVFVITEKGFKK